MLEKLPAEILGSEICLKYLTIIDTIQVGVALNLNGHGIFDPERIYPKYKWIASGYDSAFYEILMDCINRRKTLADDIYKNDEVIGKAFEVMDQMGSRSEDGRLEKDMEVFRLLKDTFEIEKLIGLSLESFMNFGFLWFDGTDGNE